MSGLEVIGGISAVISIIDASIKIYNSARKDIKLSKTFETVGRRLPIILNTLETCKNDLKTGEGSMTKDVCQALKKIFDSCNEKAGKLKVIFEDTMPGEKDTWEKRYFKVVRRFGKGNKVEDLMIAITEDVQLVVNKHVVNSVTPEQKAKLNDITEEMKSLPSSIPEEESSRMSFNTGGGQMTAFVHEGNGKQYNLSGSGQQYIAETQNIGKD
jgi:hypothetical protein